MPPYNSTAEISAELSRQSQDKIVSQLEAAFAKGIAKGLGVGSAGGGGGSSSFDRQFTTAFGNMSNAARAFDSNLARVNKRVIEFGITIGILKLAKDSFTGIVSSTRDVEGAMSRLQSVLNVTGRQIDGIRTNLFNLARATGTSFDDAAKSLEQVAKVSGTYEQALARTRTALALARVGNIDATEAVKGLTAAFATFAKQGETWDSLANKIAATTRAFPLGAKDAVDALDKFGAQAEDAGISVNKLLGYIAALQARTGQGGANIGSSLERIFARLQNPSNLSKLETIPGLDLLTNTGQLKNGIGLLDEITRKYGQLGEAQKRLVSQTLGGSFGSGANALKSLLADLSSPSGISARASQSAANSATALQQRLTIQNNNLDTSLKNLGTTAKQIGDTVGRLSLTPALNNLIGAGNKVGDALGSDIGQGILKGIGGVLSGPGLAIAARIAFGALKREVPQLAGKLGVLGGFGAASGQTAGVDRQDLATINGINRALAQATSEEKARYLAATSVLEQQRLILSVIERQNLASRAISANRASLLEGLSPSARTTLGEFGGHAAGGYLPAMSAESRAISMGVGGAPRSARPVYMPNLAGGSGLVVNNSEFVTPGGAVFNRDMIKTSGLPPGSVAVAAGGFIPNKAYGDSVSPFDYGSLSRSIGPSSGLHGATPLSIGNTLTNQEIDNLNDMFKSIKEAGSLGKAQAVVDQIHAINQTLDTISSGKLQKSLSSLSNEDVVALNARKAAESRANQIRARDFDLAVQQGGGTSDQFSVAAADRIIDRQRAAQDRRLASRKASKESQFLALEESQPTSAPISESVLRREIASGEKALDTLGYARSVAQANASIGPYGYATSPFGKLDPALLDKLAYGRSVQSANEAIAPFNAILGNGPFVSQSQLQAISRREQARTAPIFFGGKSGESSVFIPPGPGDVSTRPEEQTLGEGRAAGEHFLAGHGSLAKQETEDFFNDLSRRKNRKLNPNYDGLGLPGLGARGRTQYPSPIGPPADLFYQAQRENEALLRKEEAQNLERERAARNERINNRLFIAGIGASFIAGNIDDGPGGTTKGIVRGGIKGALEGLGTGTALGSAFGLPGAVIAGGVGLVTGGALGAFGKRNQSFDEVIQANQGASAKSNQRVQAISQYRTALDNLKDAQERGSSKDIQRTLYSQLQDSFVALGDDQKAVLAAGRDPTKLANLQGDIQLASNKTEITNGAVSAISGLAAGKPEFGQGDVVSALFGVVQGGKGLTSKSFAPARLSRTLDPSDNDSLIEQIDTQKVNSEKLIAILSSNPNFTKDQANTARGQLSNLSNDQVTSLLSALGGKFSTANQNIPQLAKFQTPSSFNPIQFRRQLQEQNDTDQEGLNQTTTLKQYLQQASGQRVSTATRLLGAGRVRGVGGKFGSVDSVDIEGGYRLDVARDEADLANARSVSGARISFRNALNPDSINPDDPKQVQTITSLRNRINGASSPADFEGIRKDANLYLKNENDLVGSTNKALDKVIKQLDTEIATNNRQVQLVQDSIVLQRLEVQASQQTNLLLKGQYNAKAITGYGGPTTPLARSEYLDKLGLLQGSGTADLQYTLRRQSTLETLRVLASRQLGRPVGSSIDSIETAAGRLISSGTVSNKELGQRIYNSAENLKTFNPFTTAKQLLTDPSKLGLSQLQGLTSSGVISTGEAAIVKSTSEGNKTLDKIYRLFSGQDKGAGAVPVVSSDQNGTPILSNRVLGTNDSVNSILAGPLPSNSGSDSIAGARKQKAIQLPPYNVTSSRLSSPDPSHPDFFSSVSDADTQPGFLKSSAQGFRNQLITQGKSQDEGGGVQSTYDIGIQIANNLDQSFSKFFGNFVTGAERGRTAFRDFASSIFADASRLYADNAVKQILGGVAGVFGVDKPAAMGGYIGLATGGSVPVMLTGGEYVFGPGAAKRLGSTALHALNGGAYAGGGLVRGGSGISDDVATSLPPGSFVVKKTMVGKYGAGYLDALAGGVLPKREGGGFLSGYGGYAGVGSLLGGLIGAIADKKNRAQGFLIGAGIGGLAGGALNSLNKANFLTGSPLSSASAPSSPVDDSSLFDQDGNYIGANSGTPGVVSQSKLGSVFSNKDVQGVGTKLAAAGILGGVTYALNQPNKVLDTPGIERNAIQIEQDQQGYINNRPAGSFVNTVRGPNGTYNILGYTGPATEYSYDRNGGQAVTFGGAADGGEIAGPSLSPIVPPTPGGSSYAGALSPSSAGSIGPTTVAPVITIHNYGNGNSTATTQNAQSNPNHPAGGADTASQITKAVQQIVDQRFIDYTRPGGAFQTRQRNVQNPYGA